MSDEKKNERVMEVDGVTYNVVTQPNGHNEATPVSFVNRDQSRIDRERQARRNSAAIPGATLADQVEHAFHNNCYEGTLQQLRDALEAAAAGLGTKFWKLMSGSYLTGREQEKQEFVKLVRERTAAAA